MPATIDDTYAEAFRSIYASVLITARDAYWLDMAWRAATGNASSTILCDCEAGLDRFVAKSDTPDGRPGAVVQFHVPRFHKDRLLRLERSVLVRVSQNVLTCPTAAAFNVLPAGENWFPLGRKLAYFGDGHQFTAERHGRRCWVVPILSGEFVIERRVAGPMGSWAGTSGSSAQRRRPRSTPRPPPPRRERSTWGDPAVSRRRCIERLEGGKQVQVRDRQHVRRILPDAAR